MKKNNNNNNNNNNNYLCELGGLIQWDEVEVGEDVGWISDRHGGPLLLLPPTLLERYPPWLVLYKHFVKCYL